MHFSPLLPGRAFSRRRSLSWGGARGYSSVPRLYWILYAVRAQNVKPFPYFPGCARSASEQPFHTAQPGAHRTVYHAHKPPRNTSRSNFPLCAAVFVCYNGYSSKGWRLIPMASKTSAREERKKKMVRVVAIVACAALLLTALLPYIASALY